MSRGGCWHVQEMGPIDFWGGAPIARDIDLDVEEAMDAARSEFGVASVKDVSQGPFVVGWRLDDEACEAVPCAVAWKISNNGLTYLATRHPRCSRRLSEERS